MGMLVRAAGRVRGLFAGNYAENREDEQFHLNSRGDAIYAQGLPELAELVRLGDSWQVITVTGTAALTALPTTVPGLRLWNGEPAGGKCYVIDSVVADQRVIDTTQSGGLSLFAMMNKPPIAAPTDLALAIRSPLGKTYGGKARTIVSVAVDDGWYPHGTTASTAPTAVGGSVWSVHEAKLFGLYIVVPGSAFSIQAVKVGSGTAAVFFTIRWHEVQLDVRQ